MGITGMESIQGDIYLDKTSKLKEMIENNRCWFTSTRIKPSRK